MKQENTHIIPPPVPLDHYFNCQTLKDIYTTSFVLDDLRLYLDTHPEDQNAMECYEKYQNLRNKAIQKHEKESGPIISYQVEKIPTADADIWQWVYNPWPWEKEV